MKKITKLLYLSLISILLLGFVGCSSKTVKYTDAESLITDYVKTYYTVTTADVEMYDNITRGGTSASAVAKLTKPAEERFKPFLSEEFYKDLQSRRMSYLRIKEASEKDYTVAVKSIKLEKASENKETKGAIYYYDIELVQTSSKGVENIKDRKQITVYNVENYWQITNSYLNGY